MEEDVDEDKDAFIVYMTGVDVVLAKVDPLKFKEVLMTKAGGQVKKVFFAGRRPSQHKAVLCDRGQEVQTSARRKPGL